MSHEPQNLDTRRLALTGAVLAAAVAAVLVICFFLWRSWAVPGFQPANYPPQPRLQPFPARDLTTFRRQQGNEDIWQWEDRSHDVARIPVQRAMEIMAKEAQR